MQYGMPTLIENAALEDNIALCRRLGLQFIELNMNFPEYQLDTLENTDLLTSLADAAGIYYTVHLDENLDIANFNPLVSGAYLETVRRTIEAAKGLVPLRDRYGDKAQPVTLNMHMLHGIHITLPGRIVQMYEQNLDRYLASFRQFRQLCDDWIGDASVAIAIENTDGFTDYECKAIECLLESPKFVLTWDIGHSKVIGESDVPFITAHRSRLKHFHIHDATEAPAKNHLALGDGEIDLMDRLALAKQCGARCVLETKTIAALEKSTKWLSEKSLL